MTTKSSKEVVASAKKKLTESVESTAVELEAKLAKDLTESAEPVANDKEKPTDEVVKETTELNAKGASNDANPNGEAEIKKALKEASEEKSEDEPDEDDKKKVEESTDGSEDDDSTVEKVSKEAMSSENLKEDLNAILSADEQLSDSFKAKIATVYEAALSAKVKTIAKEIQEAVDVKLAEKVKAIEEATEQRTEAFLDIVAEEWINENSLQIESGLRAELAEGFFEDFKALLESYNVSMPSEKVDVLEAKSKEVEDLKEQVSKLLEATSKKDDEIFAYKKSEVIREISEGLADTQKEKLSVLVSDVVAENLEVFKEKVSVIKESYFAANKTEKEIKKDVSLTESVSPSVESYINSASRFNKNSY